MAQVEKVKELIGVLADALTAYPGEYSASELLSTFATMFLSTSRVIMDKAPEAREGIIGIVQHIQLQLVDVPTDKLKIN
jgi:hypothetical protein